MAPLFRVFPILSMEVHGVPLVFSLYPQSYYHRPDHPPLTLQVADPHFLKECRVAP